MPRDDQTGQRGLKTNPSANKGQLPTGNSWFFGIGINEYEHFPDLNNAVGDVKAIHEVLRKKYHLDESITLFNQEATRRNIFKQLKSLLKSVGPDDKLFILFSGHGFFSQTNEGFWVPHEAEPDFEDDYLPNFHLKHYLEHIKARHILVVSDSCFSGSLFAEGTTRKSSLPDERLELKRSRYGICSGRDNEEVWDGPEGGHSPFANSIIEFLEENQQSPFRASLLAEEVFNRTTVEYRQTPRHGQLFGVGDKGGQYLFRLRDQNPAWKISWKKIQQQPEESLQALHNKILLVDEYTDKYSEAENLSEAFELGEFLEHKRAFFIAKGSMFRLKQFSRKKTPFQKEAKRLLKEYKEGYVLPEETEITEPASPPEKQDGKSSQKSKPNTFTDPRDGQTYKTVELNGLIWMAENFNYDVGEGCWAHKDDPQNIKKFGRLYDWEAARKASPSGWRLPTDEEWKVIAKAHGGYYRFLESEEEIGDSKKAFHALIKGGSSGFDAQLSGFCSSAKRFGLVGRLGCYWTGSEKDVDHAFYYNFVLEGPRLDRSYYPKRFGFSCRCVKNAPSKSND